MYRTFHSQNNHPPPPTPLLPLPLPPPPGAYLKVNNQYADQDLLGAGGMRLKAPLSPSAVAKNSSTKKHPVLNKRWAPVPKR